MICFVVDAFVSNLVCHLSLLSFLYLVLHEVRGETPSSGGREKCMRGKDQGMSHFLVALMYHFACVQLHVGLFLLLCASCCTYEDVFTLSSNNTVMFLGRARSSYQATQKEPGNQGKTST